MEYEGIKLDAGALGDFAAQLSKEIDTLEKTVCHLAGTTFNVIPRGSWGKSCSR